MRRSATWTDPGARRRRMIGSLLLTVALTTGTASAQGAPSDPAPDAGPAPDATDEDVDEPIDWLTPDIGPPVLRLDARELLPGEVVDLVERARAAGCAEEPSGDDHRVRVLEVLDSHLLRIESIRGVETVSLGSLRGALPQLPDEVNTFLRETALPALREELAEAEIVEPELSWNSGVRQMRDPAGRRVVSLRVRPPGGDWRDLATEIVELGWGCPAIATCPDAELPAWVPAERVDLPDVGVRSVPSWQEFRDDVLRETDAVLAITDVELTRRARQIQFEMAELLEWEPDVIVEARWCTVEEMREVMLQQILDRRHRRDEDVPEDYRPSEEALEELVADHVSRLVAFSPAGPMILVNRRRTGFVSDEPTLDLVLAHEIAHQYQEETFQPYGLDDVPYPYGEGHANLLARRWVEHHGHPFWTPVYEQESQEFEDIVRFTGIEPDALLRLTMESDWFWRDEARALVLLANGEPAEPQPTVAYEPRSAKGRRATLRLSNPGDETLAGLYTGDWFVVPPDASFEEVESQPLTPPFHLVLPPGGTLRVELAEDRLARIPAIERIHGVWSPTPVLEGVD